MPPLIKTIRVQNVRAHKDFSIQVAPSATVIVGANGTGKTSLIEALYVVLQGSSFKSSDNDIVRQGASWYRVDVGMSEDRARTVKFNPEKTTGRKQFIIDGKTHYRLGSLQKFPVVLFEPDDLRLLGGSPARRRQFIDRLIGQVDPKYAAAVRRYERALKQRNTLLKLASASEESLFAWNVALSEYGSYIIRQRLQFTSKIDAQLNGVYCTISGTADAVRVRYSHTHADTAQKLLSDLHMHKERDRLMGYTSTGPHRHDIIFEFNNTLAVDVASRGEIRSVILALKFIEVRITEEFLDVKPLILLDDVFSELDEARQKNLVTEFTDHQIIITSVATVPVKGSEVIQL